MGQWTKANAGESANIAACSRHTLVWMKLMVAMARVFDKLY